MDAENLINIRSTIWTEKVKRSSSHCWATLIIYSLLTYTVSQKSSHL